MGETFKPGDRVKVVGIYDHDTLRDYDGAVGTVLRYVAPDGLFSMRWSYDVEFALGDMRFFYPEELRKIGEENDDE